MDFSKIILVLKREYITRVRTKSFLLATLLTPLAFVVLIAIVVVISISDSEVEKRIGIIDNTEVLFDRLSSINELRYTNISSLPLDTVRAEVLRGDLDGYIILEPSIITESKSAVLVHDGTGGLSFQSSVRSDLREVVRDERLSQSDVSPEVRDIFESRLGLEAVKLTAEGETDDNTAFAAFFGFALGILIFIGIFGYGAILMRSIIEEKTSRIVEIIASSIKPIELMFGKIFGICLLALTQFSIWFATYAGLSIIAAPIALIYTEAQMNAMPAGATEVASSFDPALLEQMQIAPSVYVYFFIFFVIGFLIYSALFAAIGAAVDSEQDTQQFMIPVMIPIMLGYFFNMKVIENPDSNLAIFSSLFPLTSPINMISRIAATDVPFWQIALSIALMIGTFIGVMILAAKIYRVGILMYGKKPSFRELAKWMRQD